MYCRVVLSLSSDCSNPGKYKIFVGRAKSVGLKGGGEEEEWVNMLQRGREIKLDKSLNIYPSHSAMPTPIFIPLPRVF